MEHREKSSVISDRLEELEVFEIAPRWNRDRVWQKLDGQLSPRKRVLPIWYYAAAVITLLIGVFIYSLNKTPQFISKEQLSPVIHHSPTVLQPAPVNPSILSQAPLKQLPVHHYPLKLQTPHVPIDSLHDSIQQPIAITRNDITSSPVEETQEPVVYHINELSSGIPQEYEQQQRKKQGLAKIFKLTPDNTLVNKTAPEESSGNSSSFHFLFQNQ